MGTEIYNRDKQGKFSSLKSKFIRFTKRTAIVMFVMSCIGWGFYGAYVAGKTYNPRVVEAQVTTVITKPIAFSDIPMLVKICKAESGNKQFNSKGDVLRGKVNPSDIGYCQINEYIHNDEARRLGLDIYTEQGNKDYAVVLFLREGSAPWNSSKVIWNK